MKISQKRETFARLALFVILIGMPIAVFGYQRWLRPAFSPVRVIDITASAPEAGGFQPAAIEVAAGETVTLRFLSTDVTHGIAIGPGLGIDLGYVDPGHVKEVTLTFEKGGTYTFYCNVWCSPAHWRMRGLVEVRDPAERVPVITRDPVIEKLIADGVNIDDDHSAESTHAAAEYRLPLDRRPSAVRGAALMNTVSIPANLRDPQWQREHAPAQAMGLLAEANPAADPADLIDVLAYLWAGNPAVRPDTAISTLYAKNCAACHGPAGGGDGPAAKQTVKPPAAFADPAYMFTRRADVLYAKIRRGGMGTDMPNFGTLFTVDETWALVDYLWRLAFSGVAQSR